MALPGALPVVLPGAGRQRAQAPQERGRSRCQGWRRTGWRRTGWRRTGQRRDQGTSRSKLDDVAALAGVGIATVDRVLNERGGVRPETARRVLQAARKRRLARILPASHHRGLRFEVLLSRPELPLIERMSRTFADLAATLGHSIVVQRSVLADDRPAPLAERLRATKANAVIAYAPEHPAIHDAIARLADAGVPVVTLISDVPAAPRLAYAGT